MRFWRKDRELPPAEEVAAAETLRDRLIRELAEIEPPAEMYYIGLDYQTSTWWVDGWAKRIEYPPYNAPQVSSGHARLVSLLPSRERAELWLAAHIKPTAARMAYDAGGQPIVAPALGEPETTDANP